MQSKKLCNKSLLWVGYNRIKDEEGIIRSPIIERVQRYIRGGLTISFPSAEEWWALPEEIEIFC